MHDLAFALLLAFQETDRRSSYDVAAYRLDLIVDPATRKLSGEAATEGAVTADELATLVLDLRPPFEVSAVAEIAGPLASEGALTGTPLVFRRTKLQVEIDFATPKKKGERFSVAVSYAGKPRARSKFAGFHWEKTPSGEPWIGTSCQDEGSASWWPGKDSFFHPEDKPERVYVNATVPEGLVAVSNGRLAKREKGEKVETFRWIHEYPLPTYSVTLNIAPYTIVENEIAVEGNDGPIPFAYYVLPQDVEKAKLQFEDVPEMLAAWTKTFGPFPFPKSKYALVQTSFWGMEHSSAIAYGSSFPAWLDENGGDDPFARRNELFDYILVHESAHEWWGNAVTAKTWGDFWIHEGLATYAELVYLEIAIDAETAQEHFEKLRATVAKTGSLHRGKGKTSTEAYDSQLYQKGACVLNTLRWCMNDDEAWWKALREFQARYRYKNADTEDFRAIVEEVSGKDWKQFFEEWFYGRGYPTIEGVVTAKAQMLALDLTVAGTDGGSFHVPIELAWREGPKSNSQRIELAPGKSHVEIPTKVKARDAEIHGLERVLCEQHVRFE